MKNIDSFTKGYLSDMTKTYIEAFNTDYAYPIDDDTSNELLPSYRAGRDFGSIDPEKECDIQLVFNDWCDPLINIIAEAKEIDIRYKNSVNSDK